MGSSPDDPGPMAAQSVRVEHRAGVEGCTCTQTWCFGGSCALSAVRVSQHRGVARGLLEERWPAWRAGRGQ
eukprot:4378122-Prymnesium_polylepis.1